MRRTNPCILAIIVVLTCTFAVRAETTQEKIDRGRNMLGTPQNDEGVALLKSAASELEATIQQHPKEIAPHYHLGRVYFYLGRDRQAAAQLDKAIELAPNEAEFRFFRGVIARYMNDTATADASLKRASELDPNRADIWCEWGDVLADQDRLDAAGEAFQHALKLDSKNPRSLNGMIDVLMSKGRNAEAVPLLKKLVKLTPNDPNAWYNLGQAHQLLKHYDASLAAFQKVVSLDGNDWRARAKVIQNDEALGKTKERDEARKDLLEFWKRNKAKIKSKFYCRDQFEVGNWKVMVFEYFELKGERAVRYSFNVRSKTDKKQTYRVSLGSYDATNEVAHETGTVKKGQRLFHLDRYFPNDAHETFRFFVGEPSYDKTKALVIKIIKDEIQPESSTVPTSGS